MKKNKNMLSYIEKYKSKRGINFATTDGALYHSLRVVFTIGFIYIMIFHLLYLLSAITLKADYFASVKTIYITVAVCAAGIVLGYILNSTKFKLAGCLVTFVPLIMNLYIFFNISVSEKKFLGTATHFYYRFAFPALVILFAITFMAIIDIRSKIKTDKLYRHLEEELYRQHKDCNLSSLTSEQWEEIIDMTK